MSSKLIPMKDQAALVLEDGKIYKIQHKRQRKILSCVPCHQRKIKCSRDQPACSNCLKNNWDCVYFLNDRISKGRGTPIASTIVPPTDDAGDTHTDTDAQIKTDRPFEVPCANSQVKKQELLRAIEQAKELLTDEKNLVALNKRQKRKYVRRKNTTASPQQDEINESTTNSISSASPSLTSEELTVNELSLPTSSTSASLPISNSNTSLPLPALLPTPATNTSTPTDLAVNDNSINHDRRKYADGSNNFNITNKVTDIFKYLPSKQRSYLLLEHYQNTVHPILPLIDIRQYAMDHDQFWTSLESSTSPSTDFLLLLFPMLYASARSQFHQLNSDDLFQEMCAYHEATDLLYTLYNFPNRYSLKMLTGFVLINSIIENPNITTIAQLPRLAQRVMLTRDPTSYHGITDPTLVQSRRILFWQIFQLDTLTSLHNNLPPLIKLDEFDTALPVEVVQGQLNPSLCFLNAKYRFVLLLNELCSQSKKGTFQGLKERIVDLHACCTGSALSLNSYSQQQKEANALTPYEAKFIEWAVYMLNTFADRACLLLHLNIIKTSMPILMRRHRLWQQESSSRGMEPLDPIINSGYGRNFLMIQTILNDSGNLTLDQTAGSNDVINNSNGLIYNYEDLTNNLIPASLHYLDEFLKYHSDDTYSCYNWELMIGNMPINAITFALKTLALDLNRVQQMDKIFILQTDLRYVLLSKAIPLVELKLDPKTSVCRHCFHLVKLLFTLIRVKFGSTMTAVNGIQDSSRIYFNKYDIGNNSACSNTVVPQPSLKTWNNQNNSILNDERNVLSLPPPPPPVTSDMDNNRILSITSIINNEELFNDGFFLSGNLLYNNSALDTSNTTSCAQIAPRTMKALASLPRQCSTFSLPNQQNNGDASASRASFGLTSFLKEEEFVGSQANNNMSFINDKDFENTVELGNIYKDVQRYIVLRNGEESNDNGMETIESSDEYYREFENGLLEVICGILSS